MEYQRFKNTIVARIDRGEEILSQIKAISEKEGICLAQISAIGAIDRFIVGAFHPATKQYASKEFHGDYEIVSLSGTVNTMNGEFYCHCHLSAANASGAVVGGHLNEAHVSATCEMVLQVIDGVVDRRFSEEIGLNLFSFAE